MGFSTINPTNFREGSGFLGIHTPQKTNMSTENSPLEDVFLFEIGDIPMSCQFSEE